MYCVHSRSHDETTGPLAPPYTSRNLAALVRAPDLTPSHAKMCIRTILYRTTGTTRATDTMRTIDATSTTNATSTTDTTSTVDITRTDTYYEKNSHGTLNSSPRLTKRDLSCQPLAQGRYTTLVISMSSSSSPESSSAIPSNGSVSTSALCFPFPLPKKA